MDSTILNQTQRIREKELRNVSSLGYRWLFIPGTRATSTQARGSRRSQLRVLTTDN
jgi:hypothetical protein